MAQGLILLFFIRGVAYMHVLPRIAILYSTVLEMFMDFMHFFVLFGTLWPVLAFVGMWSFGDEMPEFSSFTMAWYTQFQMIVGDFILPNGQVSGFAQVSACTVVGQVAVNRLIHGGPKRPSGGSVSVDSDPAATQCRRAISR